DGPTLDVGQAALPSGSEGLAEELPGPLGVARPGADEEHPGPLQPGAGQPDGSADALVGGGGEGEAALRLVEVAECRGQDGQVVPEGGEAGESGHPVSEALLDLAEPALVEADDEQLRSQETGGIGLAGRLAQLETGVGSALALFEVPGQDGAGRGGHAHQPPQ